MQSCKWVLEPQCMSKVKVTEWYLFDVCQIEYNFFALENAVPVIVIFNVVPTLNRSMKLWKKNV